jgi:hypothetical protein
VTWSYGLRCRVGTFCGALMSYHVHNGGPAPDEDDDDDDFVVQYLSTFLQTRTLLGNAVRGSIRLDDRRATPCRHGPRWRRCGGAEARLRRGGELGQGRVCARRRHW